MCQLSTCAGPWRQRECTSITRHHCLPSALIVDDNPLNRMVFRASLLKLGFESAEAENGLQALQMLSTGQHQPAFILLDLQMPVLDGWETARHLRTVMGVTVPILACTAANLAAPLWPTGVSVQEHALDCGADVCLTKPLQLQQLRDVLQQLCIIPLQECAAGQQVPAVIPVTTAAAAAAAEC